GKPVIATGWSGNMDFMKPGNSLPVRYLTAELDRDVGPFRKGSVWAEPDLDHAAEFMREVASDRTNAERVGKAGREEILSNFSQRTVGNMIRERLDSIYDDFSARRYPTSSNTAKYD
ncbi:MAG: hypothetical protein V2B18_19720, partial [Pseudomonadota bacterium]